MFGWCLQRFRFNCVINYLKELLILLPVKPEQHWLQMASHGYADHIYQSSFAGYFPADNPQYTCVVVIKNKPHAAIFYGASVAGPVFKEIADRLITLNAPQPDSVKYASVKSIDSSIL